MSLQSKLQQHFAPKNASWGVDAASWTDAGGARVLYWSEGPLSASQVVDAHVRAQREGAKPTLAYSGATTEVARAAAARFGVTLFNAAALPEPAPVVPADEGVLVPIMDAAPRHTAPIPIAPLIGAQMVEPLLPAHVEAPLLVAHVEPALALVVESPSAAAPAPTPPAPASLPDVDPRFPWPVAPAREPSFSLRVPAEEFALMPWNSPHALLLSASTAPTEDSHDLLVTQRKPIGIARPTQVPNWGLPWPRPVKPVDGLAIADPKLWGAQPRLTAVREDLDRVGGGSFGAVKPEGSNWLKRIQSGL